MPADVDIPPALVQEARKALGVWVGRHPEVVRIPPLQHAFVRGFILARTEFAAQVDAPREGQPEKIVAAERGTCAACGRLAPLRPEADGTLVCENCEANRSVADVEIKGGRQ